MDDACEYKREWYSKILLVSKQPIADFDEGQFYDNDG
jgi:hypothetical protein